MISECRITSSSDEGPFKPLLSCTVAVAGTIVGVNVESEVSSIVATERGALVCVADGISVAVGLGRIVRSSVGSADLEQAAKLAAPIRANTKLATAIEMETRIVLRLSAVDMGCSRLQRGYWSRSVRRAGCDRSN